jgi:hypothetical protein
MNVLVIAERYVIGFSYTVSWLGYIMCVKVVTVFVANYEN